MAVIADKCPHLKVNVVDINQNRIDAWNSDDLRKLPVFEPGLDEIIKRTRYKNLTFSCNIQEAIKTAEMVFISVNTPTKKKGIGAGQASDLKYVEACARQVAKYASGHTIVIEKSTLPVRTAEVIQEILEAYQILSSTENSKSTFDVLSNPEFLAEGSAIDDLEKPDRVLIGGQSEAAIEALSQIYSYWVPREKILHTNIWSSELAKLTSNAFLAQRVSSINSIGALCEATGADVKEVSRAIGTDSRIGSRFLDSGPGFGGSCFKKDILNLVYLSRHFGLDEVANFWEVVVSLNNWHQHRISKLIVKNLFGTVSGKKICVLGFAFKANTNDTRESAAINICKDLIEEGAILSIYDPKVFPIQIEQELNQRQSNKSNDNYQGGWFFSKSTEDAAIDTDAIVVLTEWEEFKKINWKTISKNMRKPSWVFDTRSIINSKEAKLFGLNVWKLGCGV
jgi:UDPglucose 6-dehydrogenase